jgi:hypothetical protein
MTDWKYTYYSRDAQGNILATYERSFNSVARVLQQSDYTKLIAELRDVVGDTNYKNFLVNNFWNEAFFTSALKTQVLSTSNAGTITSQYSGKWYSDYDATIASDIVAGFDDDEVIEAVLQIEPY